MPVATPAPAPSIAPSPGGKIGMLIIQLREPAGATVAAMAAATNWQVHSVRGAMSGTLKKKLGLVIHSQAAPDGRVYRIVEADHD